MPACVIWAPCSPHPTLPCTAPMQIRELCGVGQPFVHFTCQPSVPVASCTARRPTRLIRPAQSTARSPGSVFQTPWLSPCRERLPGQRSCFVSTFIHVPYLPGQHIGYVSSSMPATCLRGRHTRYVSSSAHITARCHYGHFWILYACVSGDGAPAEWRAPHTPEPPALPARRASPQTAAR